MIGVGRSQNEMTPELNPEGSVRIGQGKREGTTLILAQMTA